MRIPGAESLTGRAAPNSRLQSAGSIKGDVKRKHFSLRRSRGTSLTSSPLGHAEWPGSAVLGSSSRPRYDIRGSLKLHKPDGGPVQRANHGSIGDSRLLVRGLWLSRVVRGSIRRVASPVKSLK